ncbi:hypothetical protein SA2016_2261 [Sinomonas atrocyanea]|uniref:Uncharacterized protein n=1 Tax=Sinomonas atrocyanea TaxID=37927 RepID=A0A127A0H7_9MICC|nr:hypothetical protein [Sinomonas atrocyanea]AMM32930.1 hypothetical protein SA2016_2261 [Sinomonas atrocyanea]GEB66494.1 hypothetical protein SAT01_39420 [Sinomonas atrocyanea]GGG80641.1 hypothetical protein GCM10007172_37420 [Sinomonas atrocyanea]
MIDPVLILLAALLSAAAVAVAALLARWPASPLAVSAAGVFAAVVGWRLLANVWLLNEDFMPAVSVGDVICLIAGGLPPALVAAAMRPLARTSLVVAAGTVVAFLVNVVVL